MATPVGALSINLSLNSAAFMRDMGKSQKSLASNSAGGIPQSSGSER